MNLKLFMLYLSVQIAIAIKLQTTETEQLINNKIFNNYNRRLKPSGTVQVKFSLQLNQIVNVTSYLTKLSWTLCALK